MISCVFKVDRNKLPVLCEMTSAGMISADVLSSPENSG